MSGELWVCTRRMYGWAALEEEWFRVWTLYTPQVGMRIAGMDADVRG
jgi:hypothetical protein